MRTRLRNKTNTDWNLNNPHLWADEVIGRDIYERHTRYESKWLGWQPRQIAFLRDICDFNIPFLFAKCNRGGAKTLLTAYAAACILDNLDNFRISVVSGSKDQASICYEYARDVFIETDMSQKLKGDTTLSKTEFLNGNRLSVLPASERRTRAPRADMIIIDEACSAKPSILTSVLPQTITATKMKVVILTTPDKLVHIAKTWWDMAEELEIVRYSWNAYQCSWIPRKNIETYKKVFDKATFAIEVMAEWTSKSGSVFDHADIQAAKIDMDELPPLDELNYTFMGIDWGDANETVATVIGVTGDPEKDTDTWYVYAVRAWQRARIDEMCDGIVELSEIFEPIILSEQSSVSAFANRELRDRLSDIGIIMKQDTFTNKKHRMVNNLKMRLERRKYKIPRRFKKTINQMTNYHYKMVNDEVRDEYEKKEDDYVDSSTWANWGIHPALGKIETLGEWEFE